MNRDKSNIPSTVARRVNNRPEKAWKPIQGRRQHLSGNTFSDEAALDEYDVEDV